MEVFAPNQDGDLLAASNRNFVQKFLQSLGDAEAAKYTDNSGQPTQALVTRMKAAIFSKAYDDERLVEMMADEANPELKNMLNALSMAAPKFVLAGAVNRSDNLDLAEKIVDGIETALDNDMKQAIVDATNMILSAKRNNQDIAEFVTQQGLFADVDEATAKIAVFIAQNNRSAKKMAAFFEAMAERIESDKTQRQNLDMFGAPPPLDLLDVVNHALSVVSGSETQSSQANSDEVTYSKNNPYAAYAESDADAKKNADDWEARQPLTNERLAAMNKLADEMGFTTYIEDRHGGMGVFQAQKSNNKRSVDIEGKFINYDGESVKEAARDFTVEMSESDEVMDYFYTNDIEAALTTANEWLSGKGNKEYANGSSSELTSQIDAIEGRFDQPDFSPPNDMTAKLRALVNEAKEADDGDAAPVSPPYHQA